MRKTLIYFLVFFLIASILPVPQASAATEPTMRVKLRNYLGNQTQIIVKATGEFKTSDGTVVLKNGVEHKITVSGTTLKLYSGTTLVKQFDTSFSITPVNSEDILYINNRAYLGSFQFTIENGYIRPINSINLETYLKGVVPREMPASWHKEALKAQAISARTYALSHSRSIIDDTISYQVYGGYESNINSNAAIAETAGEVLKYNGNLISAVFSASNGGMTESNANAWGSTQLPYFTAKADTFDPKTVWSFTVKKQQIDLTGKNLATPDAWWSTTAEADTTITNNIKSWLYSNGYSGKSIKITKINNINLMNAGSGGRATRGAISFEFLVKDIKDANGNLVPQKIVYTDTYASRVRAIIGLRVIKSYLVDKVDNASTTAITVAGRGDGHGVGLSQWGAKYRADAGQTYNQILDFYYTGTNIVKEYESGTVVTTPPVISTPTDTTAPTISNIASSLDSATKTVNVSFDVNEDSTLTAYIKNSSGTVVANLAQSKAIVAGKQAFSWNVSTISNGNYTLSVITTDASGNKSSAVGNVVVQKDITAPVVNNVFSAIDLSTNKVKITFNVSEASTLTATIKNSSGVVVGTLAQNKSVIAGTQSFLWDVANIPNGTYSLNVVATDISGNKGTSTSSVVVNKPTTKTIAVKTATVSATALNVRSMPNTTSTILGKVYKGNVVTIIGQSGTWYKVQYGKLTGWVSGAYLTNFKTTYKTITVSTAPTYKTGAVTASVLNVRQYASTTSKILGTLKYGTKVTVYYKTGTWYKIKYGTTTGYVSSTYIKLF